MNTCTKCGRDIGPEEDGTKKTLLRRKLNYIANETADGVEELHKRNREAGLKPSCWEDTRDTGAFNKALMDCPELESIYNAGLMKELDELYEAAELMLPEEFEYIQRTDSELAERLLEGPQVAFDFQLDAECLKEVERLRILSEQL